MAKQYQLCGVPLATFPSSPYLGVQINDTLSWNMHINHICGKVSRLLSLLRCVILELVVQSINS